MEQDSNPSGLCKMGCGFFGNNTYQGMCSKCYKDFIKRTQQSSPTGGRSSPGTGSCGTATVPMATSSSISLQPPSLPTASVGLPTPPIDIQGLRTPEKSAIASTPEGADAASPSSQSSSLDDSTDSPGKSKKRNRCYTCRKKVGLTGFECRCSGLFCGLHRYSDKHNCTFDYKADGREQLTKANPVIVGEKIKKI